MMNTRTTIIVGTRGSQLALWQTRWVIERLRALFPHLDFSEKIIKTQGDLQQDKPLAQLGGKGLFTKALDDALLQREIDLTVHSLKDYPTEYPDGLALVAVPNRVAPNDALISAHGAGLTELPRGARIGTGSLRRIAQLRVARPDFQFADIRGNLDTRLRKLDAGQYDAILLADAGLRRLGWEDRITEVIPFETMLPAPGQGALAIVGREDDRDQWAPFNDRAAADAVTAERAMLDALGGGCHVPIGAWGREDGSGVLRLDGVVADPREPRQFRDHITGKPDEATELGQALARKLIERGAREILDANP